MSPCAFIYVQVGEESGETSASWLSWSQVSLPRGGLSDCYTLPQGLSWVIYCVGQPSQSGARLLSALCFEWRGQLLASSEISGTRGFRGGRSPLGYQEQHLWQSRQPFQSVPRGPPAQTCTSSDGNSLSHRQHIPLVASSPVTQKVLHFVWSLPPSCFHLSVLGLSPLHHPAMEGGNLGVGSSYRRRLCSQ